MVDYKGELATRLTDAWRLASEQIKNRMLHINSTMTYLQMSTASMWEIESMCTHQQRMQGLLTNMHVHLWVPTGC